MRRNATLGIGLAALVVASAGRFVAGRQIQSPAEIAARTAPPTPFWSSSAAGGSPSSESWSPTRSPKISTAAR